MPTIFLLCGLPGSGKTTLARRLERERPALRLTEDEWVIRLYSAEEAHHNDTRVAVKEVQWETTVRATELGIDVVLDWGVWSRSERDDFRARAAALGIRLELIYLDVARDELLRRLLARNRALPPDTFTVSAAELDEWTSYFEPPAPDEFG